MSDQGFYILSPKYSAGKDLLVWWGPDNSGYTIFLEQAGIYSAEQIAAHRSYYENGDGAFPVPVEDARKLLRSVVYKTDEAGKLLRLAHKRRKAIPRAWTRTRERERIQAHV